MMMICAVFWTIFVFFNLAYGTENQDALKKPMAIHKRSISMTDLFTITGAVNRYVDKQIEENNKKLLEDEIPKLIKKLMGVSQSCTGEWKKYGNHCYKFVKEKVNWSTAKSRCEAEGSSLVKVNDMAENNWIFKAGRVAYTNVVGEGHLEVYWTGGRYINNTWKWLDNTRFSFTNWYSGEPNSSLEDCVNIGWTGKWNDMGCQKGLYYICEKSS